MTSTKLIKSLGILGVAMGLLASPLAFADRVALPTVIITAEEPISPSMRSDPINDPRYLTQPAFRGPVTSNGAVADYLPSFRSEPVSDPRQLTQPRLRRDLLTRPVVLESPSFRSDPINDPFINGHLE